VQDCGGLQTLLKKMLDSPQEKLGLRYCNCATLEEELHLFKLELSYG
jgi:hypothetical protein